MALAACRRCPMTDRKQTQSHRESKYLALRTIGTSCQVLSAPPKAYDIVALMPTRLICRTMAAVINTIRHHQLCRRRMASAHLFLRSAKLLLQPACSHFVDELSHQAGIFLLQATREGSGGDRIVLCVRGVKDVKENSRRVGVKL